MAQDKEKADSDEQLAAGAWMETMDLALIEELQKAAVTGALTETMRLGAPLADLATSPTSATPEQDPTGLPLRIPTLPKLSLAEAGEPDVNTEAPTHRTDLKICQLLGEGGMGYVHLAHQHSLGRDVAIKRIKPAHQSPYQKRLLLHEGYITGQLEHPNIVPVHALGRDADDAPVIVMKRIEGISWRQLIKEPSHPAWSRVKGWSTDPLERHIEILMDVCSAVAYAHTKGYLHLDIKPDNVMLGPFGEIYLVDWGIARNMNTDRQRDSGESDTSETFFTFAGTPAYMAPEMLDPQSNVLDERTDVYLLGATLHEILTGQTRHDGETLPELIGAVALSQPFAYEEDIPQELAALSNASTRPDPTQRPTSVEAFREALIDFLRHRSSRQLSQRAQHHLDILKRILAQDSPSSGADSNTSPHEHQRHRVFQEALFGFTLALEQWPQNKDAIEGRQAAFEALIHFELQQRRADLARALLLELHSPNQVLEEGLATLEAELKAEANQREALQAMAKELDPYISQGSRSRVLIALLTLFGVLIGYFVLSKPGSISEHSITWITSIGAIAIGLPLFLLRKKIFINTYSRRFITTFVLIALALLIHRSLGGMRGTPLPHILTDDLLLIAAIVATVGINLHGALIYLAIFQVLIVFLMHFYPAAALPLILGAVFATILAMLYLVRQGKG